MDFPEPPHVKEFRQSLNGLPNFTWIPRDDKGMQELFIRRWYYAEENLRGYEILLWNHLENTFFRFTIDEQEFNMLQRVFADFTTGDKRRDYRFRHEKVNVASRTNLSEAGEYDWTEVDGTWHKQESRREAYLRELNREAKAKKGG